MYKLQNMDNELNLDDLDQVQASTENKLQVKNRFEKLSEKVITTSKERDDAIAKANAEAEARITAEKKIEFLEGFTSNISKYPQAAEFKDSIFEKVKGGYSTEDAMVSVLAKEGRLNSPTQQVQTPTVQAEGGSAPTSFEGDKTLKDMSADDKYAALLEADKSGDLVSALRGR